MGGKAKKAGVADGSVQATKATARKEKRWKRKRKKQKKKTIKATNRAGSRKPNTGDG